MIRKYFLSFLFVGILSASAGAQVRFNVVSNPYAGSGVSISVGNNGYCQQPVYNNGYVVVPNNGRRQGRNRRVVVAPVYNNGYYNQGYYNQGYYNQGYYNNGNYNNGYYVNNGYNNNQGYYPGYGQQGYYNNGRCR